MESTGVHHSLDHRADIAEEAGVAHTHRLRIPLLRQRHPMAAAPGAEDLQSTNVSCPRKTAVKVTSTGCSKYWDLHAQNWVMLYSRLESL